MQKVRPFAKYTDMIARPFWQQRLDQAWQRAPIVWLAGVRRSGKTTLAQSFGTDRCLVVNCDLPATEDMLRDPILFFKNCDRPVVVFDESVRARKVWCQKRFLRTPPEGTNPGQPAVNLRGPEHYATTPISKRNDLGVRTFTP